jgi:hypothetical protein
MILLIGVPTMKHLTYSLLVLLILCANFSQDYTMAKAEESLLFQDFNEARWANASIAKMRYRHFIEGYEDGFFHPNQAVTRIEAIVMAVRLMGLEEEAKTKPIMDPLPYSYQSELEEGYSWAKGYVSIAVASEVLLPTEYFLDPEQPASRSWVTILMMNALKLGFLAYDRRDAVPEFIDAQEFPKLSYGYVKVALEYDIITGYPDGTFQPNKEVTRAEMALLLDRTNLLKWQRKGAMRPAGVISSIEFDATGKGTVTVFRHGSTSATYDIPSDLPVSHGNELIKASELKVNDNVIFQTHRNVVIDGSYVEKSHIDKSTETIIGLKFDVKLQNGDRMKGYYSYENGIPVAYLEGNLNEKVIKLVDEGAVSSVIELLRKVNISSENKLKGLFKALEIDLDLNYYTELRVDTSEGRSSRSSALGRIH